MVPPKQAVKNDDVPPSLDSADSPDSNSQNPSQSVQQACRTDSPEEGTLDPWFFPDPENALAAMAMTIGP